MSNLIGSTSALGTLVRAARLEQGLTRDTLANATGLSPKFISHVEAGKPTAQIGKVLQLLAELGVTLHAETTVDIQPKTALAATQRRRSVHGK
jgi:transcriptional regulator with XRE-family HTH domain